MNRSFLIDNKDVGGDRVYVIAELSANHNGSLENAIAGIQAAKRAGADAVKIQTYTADTITIESEKDWFKIRHNTIWDGRTLHDLYSEAETPFEWHRDLFAAAKESGITIFSSPFDPTAVDLLEDLDCPAYKIASPEILDWGLISLVARTGKPVIMSSGIASLRDIEAAIAVFREAGGTDVAVLKCTSEYPAPFDRCNLATIKHIQDTFGVCSGLSDHTLGWTAPVVAVGLGAKIIEKHFIVDRSIGGPDASFSLDLAEFTAMVKAVREAEVSIGRPAYKSDVDDTVGRGLVGRSLFAVRPIAAGEAISLDSVRSIRPGYGLHPKFLTRIVGKVATRNIDIGDPIGWSDIRW